MSFDVFLGFVLLDARSAVVWPQVGCLLEIGGGKSAEVWSLYLEDQGRGKAKRLTLGPVHS